MYRSRVLHETACGTGFDPIVPLLPAIVITNRAKERPEVPGEGAIRKETLIPHVLVVLAGLP